MKNYFVSYKFKVLGDDKWGFGNATIQSKKIKDSYGIKEVETIVKNMLENDLEVPIKDIILIYALPL